MQFLTLKYSQIFATFNWQMNHMSDLIKSIDLKFSTVSNLLSANEYSFVIRQLHRWNIDLALTHWGQVTHICISNLTIMDSNNVFSFGRRRTIVWTNAGLLVIGPLGINYSEILIKFHMFSFKKCIGSDEENISMWWCRHDDTNVSNHKLF